MLDYLRTFYVVKVHNEIIALPLENSGAKPDHTWHGGTINKT